MEELLEHIRKNWGKVETCASCDSQIPTGLCAGCLQYSYCGESCQSTHWIDFHQFECIGGREKRGRDEGEPKEGEKSTISIADLKKDPWSLIIQYLNADDLKNVNLVSKATTRTIRELYFSRFRVRLTSDLLEMVYNPKKNMYEYSHAEIFPFIRATIEEGDGSLTAILPNVTDAIILRHSVNWNAVLSLKNLTSLFLTQSSLTEIPAQFASLSNLEKLDLSSNILTKVPVELGTMTRLVELSLSFNELNTIPAELANLTLLEKLWLGSNKLMEIPPEFGNLTRLIELALFANSLTTLPRELGKLVRLERLDASTNELIEIPPEFGNLLQLKTLLLNGNFLSELPSELGNLTNLKRLDVSENHLTTVPRELGNLRRLKTLELSHNQLREIFPETLSNLVNLKHLFLNENLLTEIPYTIGNLRNLLELDLSVNQLTELPDEMRNLTRLSNLNLFDNDFEDEERIRNMFPNADF